MVLLERFEMKRGTARARRSGVVAALALALGLSAASATLAQSSDGAADAAAHQAVDIAAATLTVDTAAQQARFSGEVTVRRGDWVLRCPSLLAHYDADGALEQAQADGPVELAGPQFWAEAGTARYEREPEAIVLGGEPSVRRGQSVLRADEVRVDLASGRVEMRGVRGRLVMEPEASAPPAPASDGAE